jgi:hypothetical protein
MAAAILARRPEANTDLVDLWSLDAFGSLTDVKRHLGVVPHVSKIWPRIDDDDHDRETLMARTLTLFFKRFDQEWWNGELGFLCKFPIFDRRRPGSAKASNGEAASPKSSERSSQ